MCCDIGYLKLKYVIVIISVVVGVVVGVLMVVCGI